MPRAISQLLMIMSGKRGGLMAGLMAGLMVSALDSGEGGLGSSSGRGYCAVFLVPLSTLV